MKFHDIDEALDLGCIVRGFRSDQGFVTMVIEKGPGICITAFGGILHGKHARHPLYRWLSDGNTFDCRKVGENVLITLKGKTAIHPPAHVKEQAKLTGKAVIWERDGHRYKTTWSKVITGSGAEIRDFATSVVDVHDAVRKYDLFNDLLMDEVLYEAKADTASEAMERALAHIS